MARLNLVAANPQKEIKPRAPKAPRPVVVTPSNDDQKDHFITKNGLSYAGSHLIIDLWEAKGLDERERIETALIDAVTAAGATLLHIHLHKFEDEKGQLDGCLIHALERYFGHFAQTHGRECATFDSLISRHSRMD